MQVARVPGLALRNGIVLPNSPGTIATRIIAGEVQVIVLNAGDAPFTVERGMRGIAQAGCCAGGFQGCVAGGRQPG